MQNRNYATKKKGKTEVYPFWNLEDIKKMIDYFKECNDWDSYLTFMFGLLLGRRIGDTVMVRWSDFFYENGKRKEEITTIEEQKTGKITGLPVSDMVYDVINTYCDKMNFNPMEHYNEYVFNIPAKTAWMEREGDKIYAENDLEKWCEYLNKDFTDRRKVNILTSFEKQKEYNALGEYLYYEVEYTDIVKWQTDNFRKKFKKAANSVGITYNVSCHSLRKTLGYWSKMIHPDDPNALEILQSIYNHADTATTLKYIGLSEERKRKYFNDFGDVIRDVEQGNTDITINNSPIVSLKYEDLREIFILIIQNKENSDIGVLNDAMRMVETLKIKNI
jgi:integrase